MDVVEIETRTGIDEHEMKPRLGTAQVQSKCQHGEEMSMMVV